MTDYVIKRLASGIMVLLGVTIIVSSIVYLSPVDPAALTFGQRMDDATLVKTRKEMGLDNSLPIQVLTYVRDVSPLFVGPASHWQEHYDGVNMSIVTWVIGCKWPYLRRSYQTGRQVSEMILTAFPNTMYLALAAISISILLGLLLGSIAAFYQGEKIDIWIVGVTTLGYSIPSYVTAIIFGVLFGYYLRDYTGLDIQGSLYELNDFGDKQIVWRNLILPSLALGIRPLAIVTQLMRSSMIDVKGALFVRAAKAKGLSARQVIWRHMIRNALNPVVTALSGWFASLLAGAFFIEFIFNFKGLGFMSVNALLTYDIPVVLGVLLFTSSLFILINIAVDILYRILDPRVSLTTTD